MIVLVIDIQIIVAATMGGIGILYGILFWFMPRLTRHDLYFAVTVAPGFRDQADGKSILARYRLELISAYVLALVVFVPVIVWFPASFVSAGLLIELLASFIVFYRGRQRVRPFAVAPTTIREAELGQHDRVIPGGGIAASGPFILLAATGLYLWFRGGETTVRVLAVYLLSTVVVLIAQTVVLYGLIHWVRPVYASGGERDRERKFRRTVSAIVLGAEYYVTLQASWIILAPHRGNLMAVGLLPLAFVFVLAVIVALTRLGQGGSRMAANDQKASTGSAVPIGDRTPDRYWKLGLFYFNRDDSAVFVEKRFGLGYSLNFARPTAWLILSLILLAPLILILAHLTRFLPRFA